MEGRYIVRQKLDLDQADLIVERVDLNARAVFNHDARSTLEWHREIAVESPARHTHRQRRVVSLVKAVTKKVAERYRHRRFGLIIPVHLERYAAQVMQIVTGNRNPDTLDDSRSLGVEQNGSLARGDLEPICVPSSGVV
jgi:hypothetical protein